MSEQKSKASAMSVEEMQRSAEEMEVYFATCEGLVKVGKRLADVATVCATDPTDANCRALVHAVRDMRDQIVKWEHRDAGRNGREMMKSPR